MEDSRQRNSPDSSTNEDIKSTMTNNNHISGTAAASSAEAASRTSSKNLTLGFKCPKGCKTIFVDESTFAGHLLSEHNVKLVVTSQPPENQQLVEGSQSNTTPSPLSSLSSPSTTPPIAMLSSTSGPGSSSNVITKCPVCRLQVDDLPFHFATAHHSTTTKNKSPTNHDRSEVANNNNIVLNRRNTNLTNGVRSPNGDNAWATSPSQTSLVVGNNDAIKSEVLSYEEMESGIEADSIQQPKAESPNKRKLTSPMARAMPIFLPSQPLPASQLVIEEGTNITNQRSGNHSPLHQLPMTLIPTVVGNPGQLPTSLTHNGQTNTSEALHDADNKTAPRRINGLLGQQPLHVKVEDGGAMNLSIKDSPKSEGTKVSGGHSNGLPLPLLDGRGLNGVSNLRTNSGLPFMLNTDSNVSSASMSDLESEGGQENGVMNGKHYDELSMQNDASDKKRRRKQTSVPPASKDQRYWARRLKNNEAAKRSRDMRIQREKIIFDENTRLEGMVKDLKTDQERLTTENKELKLKMEFILEENARLQEIIRNVQVQQHEQRQIQEEMDGQGNRINGHI